MLSQTHVIGMAKARFFATIGYTQRNADELEEALLSIARYGEVREQVTTEYGTKYVVDGWLEAPACKVVAVRTVWIVEIGQEAPRLITAYPLEEESQR